MSKLRRKILTKKPQFYVVWKGRTPGIYASWEECSAQVNGFSGARYKGFKTRAEAEAAFRSPFEKSSSPATLPIFGDLQQQGEVRNTRRQASSQTVAKPAALGARASGVVRQSWAVDAACNPVPGKMEYRGVETATGNIVFAMGPFEDGTNNVGEFLALVQALRLCQERSLTHPIYSDSKTALAWVRDKRCKTQLARTRRNAILFTMIEEAEAWLQDHSYPNKVLKWKTEDWGEIPADYGRK